jgi:hypothetical protein
MQAPDDEFFKESPVGKKALPPDALKSFIAPAFQNLQLSTFNQQRLLRAPSDIG